MPIEEVTAYQCTCGRCGKGFNTEGDDWPMIWRERSNLLEWLRIEEQDGNWKQIDGEWYCSDCIEWNEEKDEQVVKAK